MRAIWQETEVEYVNGGAYAKVSPRRKHSAVQKSLIAIVDRCAKGRGFCGGEWRFELAPGISLVPDAAYVSFDRLRPLAEEEQEAPKFAPEIAIEVRSPSDTQALIDEKTRQYLAHGATLVINADPQTRTIVAHTSGSSAVVYGVEETFACSEVDWLTFRVSEAFEGIAIPR